MDKELNIRGFFKEKKFIVSLFTFLAGEVFLFILNDKSFFENTYVSIGEHPIKNAYVLAAVLLFVFIVWIIFSYYKVKYYLYEEKDKTYKEKENELKKALAEVKEEAEKYKGLIDTLNNKEMLDEGNRLFCIAMALDTFEPNKFKLLAEAAEKFHNLYAGLYIANIYHSGLSNGNIEIVKKDYDKAYYYYNLVVDYDYAGVVAWRIGWMHERKQIDLGLSKEERLKEAFKYYEIAKEKNYVKAYNSIGKFYQKGWGVKKNLNEAIYYFRQATKMGDTFSILNEAYIHAENPETFELAIDCFNDAIQQNVPLAYLKFGEFLEQNLDYFLKNKYNFDAKYVFDLYYTVTSINNGPICARAYYSLGNLISKYPDTIISKRKEIEELFGSAPIDFVNASYKRALEVFEYNIKKNIKLSDTDIKIYNILKDNTSNK
ncbi:MAG: sel1 repeat family protein [Clostridia bacterium]|nr:sel1 repeat family protein [Clostridia bacterium]